MLARLTRWLRVAGEDVLAPARPGTHHPTRDELWRQAGEEGRVVLTRDQSFPGPRSQRLLLIATDLDQQLLEFYRAYPADPLANLFTHCTACNGSTREVSRAEVLELLPPAVRERGRDFRRCTECGHIYWDGSHTERIRARLAAVREVLGEEASVSPGTRPSGAPRAKSPELAPDDHPGWARFDDFLRALLARLDLSWSGYRRPRRSLRSRLVARMNELGLREYAEYLDYLTAHPEESERLAQLLAVTISRFFRDREDWFHLARHAFPALAASGRSVRAVSLGCASGEEPYTLCLLWDQAVRLDILAVDVRDDLLARARGALYSTSSVHSVPPDLLARYFSREGASFRLDPAVADRVRFVHLDFWRQALPGSFDLMLCRNVAFTYLGERRRQEVAGHLLESLAPGGFLMIGGGERLPEGTGLSPAGRCLYQLAGPA
jgi:chemotaxis methyl-accepting protein methylase/uncharacterized protein with PIN domain